MPKNKLTINECSEKELWDNFLDGDQAAYNQIVKTYSKQMFNYGFRLCQNEDLIRDCIQDIFLRLWNNRSNIGTTDSIKWYLLKSIKTSVIREAPKWEKNEILVNDYSFNVEFDVETKLISEFESQHIANKIIAIINQLPARQKEILYLRFYEDMDLSQISALMDISTQSVYNLLQKAYKSFRAEWLPLVLYLFLNIMKRQ